MKVEVTVEDWKADAYLLAAGTYFVRTAPQREERKKPRTCAERRAEATVRVVGRVNIVRTERV